MCIRDRESPVRFLSLDAAIAEEVVSCVRAVEKTVHGLVIPVGMSLLEIEPDPHSAGRIYLERPVVVDVAKLLGRRVIKDKDDGRQPTRKIQLLVEHIRHIHRPVAATVEQLQIFPELAALCLLYTSPSPR